jgi:hypothetical protein
VGVANIANEIRLALVWFFSFVTVGSGNQI